MTDAPSAACDNCAGAEASAQLLAVHRVYLELDEFDQPERSTTLEEIERWCAACRSTYPHEPAPGGSS